MKCFLVLLACQQALLLGRAKRESRENARGSGEAARGRGKELPQPLARLNRRACSQAIVLRKPLLVRLCVIVANANANSKWSLRNLF